MMGSSKFLFPFFYVIQSAPSFEWWYGWNVVACTQWVICLWFCPTTSCLFSFSSLFWWLPVRRGGSFGEVLVRRALRKSYGVEEVNEFVLVVFVSSVSNGLGQPELHALFLAFSVLACIFFVLLVPQLNRTGEQLYEVKVGLTREMRSRHSGDVSSTSASCTRSIPILFCSLLKLVAVCTEPRDVARGHYRLSASAAVTFRSLRCTLGLLGRLHQSLFRPAASEASFVSGMHVFAALRTAGTGQSLSPTPPVPTLSMGSLGCDT